MSPRVGLVLGAGGVVGQAYQAGVLTSLAHDLGWDPRTAEVVVGTSAGSVTATLLRLGVSASDLAAGAVEAPLSDEGAPVIEELRGDPPAIPPPTWRNVARPWRPPSPSLLVRNLRRPWAFRPSVAALTLMPAGTVDIERQAEALAEATEGAPWPERLWICTVRRRDGARVVFGRPGAPSAPLSKAVLASCAIPGYFRPIGIDGEEHLDGGVHSSTNADVLRDEGLDLVIVVASMSVAGGWAAVPDVLLRRGVHRRLDRELSRLRRAGTTVVRIEPGPRVLRAMGVNAMADGRGADVVREAFLDTGRRTSQPEVAARLASLSPQAARRNQTGASAAT
ncbi:patatin-like phospholipase family protein [Iamia sp.]|uniref:patatin-like phospholipase family protein n=1 Tax=Iamia sp. TaxID=2722710 RepID=UPI002D7F3147|nr:patatin-like phospholipase family protein [Iamia sp.]